MLLFAVVDTIVVVLLNWQVEQLNEEYYRMVNTDSEDLQTIFRAFGLSVPNDLFTAGQLRSLGTKIKVF
ncbi:MAG: hypothetical protein IIY45_06725 [Firmicutes bacterium]|nr:hypothetical protein [Bacillota bacterium]